MASIWGLKKIGLTLIVGALSLVIIGMLYYQHRRMSGKTFAAPSQRPECSLTWYHMSPPQPDTELVLSKVNQYLRKKLNITVKLKLIPFSDYETKMRTLITSRADFDLCFTSSFSNNFSQNAVKGAFLELDTLLRQYGQGILKQIPSLYFDCTRIDGKIFTIPAKKNMATQFAISFNKSYVDKYGFNLSKITKLEDLEPLLRIIKQKEPQLIPYAICNGSCHAYSLPVNRVSEYFPGGLYLDNRTNYRLFNELECPEYRQYFRLMHRWFKAGYIPADAATRTDTADLKWFSSVSVYLPETNIVLSQQFGFPVVTAPLYQPVINNNNICAYMIAISSTSKNPIQSMQFLNLLYTDPYLYNLLTNGIEGHHYYRLSPSEIGYPKGITPENNPYQVGIHTMGNIELAHQYTPHSFDEYEAHALRSPLLGFSFNPQKVMKEIENLTQVTGEVEGPLNTGTVDPDIYLPKAIAKYRAAGLDRVIAEEQRQLDIWMRKKRQRR